MPKSGAARRRQLARENPEKYAELCRKLETRRRFKMSMRADQTTRVQKDDGGDVFDDDTSILSYTTDDEAVDGRETTGHRGRHRGYQSGDGVKDMAHGALAAEQVSAQVSRERVRHQMFTFKGAANVPSSSGMRDSPVLGNTNGKRARAETEELSEYHSAQPSKRRRNESRSDSRQSSPALDPANSQLVLRSTQSVVSTQVEEAPLRPQRSFTTTRYGGDWPHLRRANKFSRMSTDEQTTTLRNWMAEVSEYADAIEAPTIPAPLMTRFFRRVKTYMKGAQTKLPRQLDDLEAAFRDASDRCLEETDREDLIHMFLLFMSPADRSVLERKIREENILQNNSTF
ncbi:hypothetical protein H2200_010665 [Cladophialophora chaetospira]|uniref:Uncharacterized protein n=1 Tax=Cladophialophora chaetospira TaxID=386627 RepID=A0AA39CDU8_9EURO|nr:hypothetical protein H2200_010665 [Cladophialophora chaetospira]